MTRRLFSFVVAVLVLGVLPLPAQAVMELYLYDPTGDTDQVEITAGQSFDVEVGFATTEPSFGLDYYFNISENGSEKFAITNRVVPAGCPFSDLLASNAELLQPDVALLDPYSEKNLGAITPGATVLQSAGLYVLAMVTISSMPEVAPGTYTLSLIGANGVNAGAQSVIITCYDYTIVVKDSSSDGSGDGSGDSGGVVDTGGDTGDTSGDGTGDTTGDGTGSTDGGTGGDGTGGGSTGDSGTGGQTGGTDTGGTAGSDSGTADSGNTDQSGSDTTTGGTGGTGSGNLDGSSGTQTGEEVLESTPTRPILGNCGAGASGVWAMAALMGMWLIRPPGRRR